MYRRNPRSIWKLIAPFRYVHTTTSQHIPRPSEFPTTQLASFLQSSSFPSNLQQGRQVHAQLILNEITTTDHLLLAMYLRCGSFNDAKNMFYRIDLGCVKRWNLMIRGLVRMGWFRFGLLFYFKMLGCGVSPDNFTFPSVVKACSGLNNVRFGALIHEAILSMGFEVNVFVGSSLIHLYVENGYVDRARTLFDKIPARDCVLWNVMLNGYVKCGELDKAMEIFEEMRKDETKSDEVTFAAIFSLCASEGMVDFGTQLHGLVVSCGLEFDSVVANALLSMYSKCGWLSDARKLFGMMPRDNLVSWNGMISGYVQNGFMQDASCLFNEMVSSGVKPDAITFSSFLPAVAGLGCFRKGKEIHGYILRHGVSLDVFLKSALIDVYFKCRDVEMARKVYNQSTKVDVVMCTAMISGFVLNGMNNDAFEIFRWLLKEKIMPNAVTLASVLPACADLAALKVGKELHGYIIKNGLDHGCHVGSAVIDMYAKCGRLDVTHDIFGRLSERDSVCWNSMITSYSQNGKPEKAIDLFCWMGRTGMNYDCVSISAALSACANLPALHYGKEIHGFMIKGSFCSDLFAKSALIDMYAKCGNLGSSQLVFDMMEEKNEISWNSIIAAYGNHGRLEDCLALFHEMLKNEIQPDHVTFLAIISACGHAGKVDDGIHYFQSMTKEYGIPARMEHYGCVVDLFGRAGRLNEAFKTIKSMPFSPDAGVWGTLLGASRNHGNVELAEVASRHLFDLDPQNSGYYVLLSNLLADAGHWGSVLKIRSLMKERGVQKVPGYSWIEVNNTTHMFVAADESHPRSSHIYSLLKTLLLELKREGYVPQLYLPMHPQHMVS
ncbi:pentatricopeptide repeat-containing protein At4g21300 [Herrania umbratica]|uniref:Pentatricopeptide repeat-containing protein At4g21300 n=1 Tax=Herrania umbratica TaxID=108875 RepID=A0A6J1BIQ3_9ROSI|nr:pentatricopeptide repeat-containing protein At4g21300 [Herrania umbratica]XP_021298155.1 pentatricopeptide repeat-containing protein At4g21300 [Herrania umbratica]XP_021298156.1 pentatricopeptide repeat-containing protein At4g21300 [Herrania umbratica]XP_021298157.1 pentatricopeptide repeat-containing protein At4g21300 [Herrania umbratica]